MDPVDPNLNELQDFFSSVLNNSTIGIIALDSEGRIKLVNDLANRLLDMKLRSGQTDGPDLVQCLEHFPALQDILSKSLGKGGGPFEIRAEFFRDNYLNIRGTAIPKGYILTIDDITSQKEMEANSVLSIIASQENERSRLAREIHDGIGPLLSTAKLELDSFLDEIRDDEHHLTYEKLLNIREIIDSITNDLRDLSHHLLPRLLDEFGLYSACKSLVNRINSSGAANVEFYCNFTNETRFDRNIELNLYRCGQELLNNAIKHSKADEILVQLIKHDSSIVMMVEDDGIGFRSGESNPEHFGIGLTNIETRVRTLDGEFTIDSVVNRGTTASIEIPL
jgi:signal transduction histidine kinase